MEKNKSQLQKKFNGYYVKHDAETIRGIWSYARPWISYV